MNRLKFLGVIIVLLSMCQCGRTNLLESTQDLTPDEQARQYLEAENWDKAIEAYRELILKEPSEYRRYPLLATCLAGRGGVALLDILKRNLENDGLQDDDGIFSAMDSFIPADPSDAQISDVNSAVDSLESMPVGHRSESSDYDYASEAAFQLNLYLAASSAMLLKKVEDSLGNFDTDSEEPESLDDLSDEEVEAIFDNLDSIIESGDERIGPEVETALEEINASEGGTQKEKLANYIAANQD